MSHECPRNGCATFVSTGKLMCGPCWKLVPQALQRAVYRAWDRGQGAGSQAHRAAMAAAIRAVNGKPGQGPDQEPEPSPHQLWEQAGEDPERYRRLMREHGYLLAPGDDGYEDAPRSLPCGWRRHDGTEAGA